MTSLKFLKYLEVFFKSFRDKIYVTKSLSLRKYFIFLIIFIALFTSFLFFYNQINSYNNAKKDRLNNILVKENFSNLNNYFINKLKSPYVEVEYVIENNDSIQKILNNFDILPVQIKNVVDELKNRKLSNIYSGRKISMVLKKTKEDKNEIIYIIYPLSNTLSVEIKLYII